MQGLDLRVTPQLLGLGPVIGLSGVFFNKAIMWGKDFYDWLKVPVTCKHVLPFVVTAFFLLLDPSLLGSGENFILTQPEASLGIGQALAIYGIKLLLLLAGLLRFMRPCSTGCWRNKTRKR